LASEQNFLAEAGVKTGSGLRLYPEFIRFLKEQARISRIRQKVIIDGLHTRQSTLEVRLAVRPQCPRI
jgi:hypothetical protein